MGDLAACGVCCAFFLPYWIVWIVIGSMAIRFSRQPNVNELSLQYLTQIKEDWKANPFIDVTFVDTPYCPSSHPEEVVYTMFEGTTHWCDCMQDLERLTTDKKGKKMSE